MINGSIGFLSACQIHQTDDFVATGRNMPLWIAGIARKSGLVAVSPQGGIFSSLMLPWVDTEAMSVFLAQTAADFPGEFCLMLLDGAGWHRAAALRVPAGMRLFPLLLYSPELNPVEHIWDYLRENYLGN